MSETESEQYEEVLAVPPGTPSQADQPSPAPNAPSISQSQPATVVAAKNNMKWCMDQFTPVGDKVKCKHCPALLSVVKERPGTAEQSHMTRKHGDKAKDKSYVSPPVKVKKRAKDEGTTKEGGKAPKLGPRPVLTPAELAEFLEHWAMRACPFKLIDDHVLFKPVQVVVDGKVCNLNRQLLKRLMVEHGEALVNRKLQESKGQYCSIALDLGTMQGKRSMDIVVHTDGQEFLYSVEPIGKGEGTAVGLYKVLLPVLNALHAAGLTVVAIVTDNASNLTAMERLIQADFPEIVCINCAIHSIQLLVTDAVYFHPDVEAVWKIIDDVRAKALKHGLVKVPKLATTRWNYAVRVLEHMSFHFEKYRAADCMTSEELAQVDRALEILLPYQVITKYLERTKANILDIAVALRGIHNHSTSIGADVGSAFLHRLMLHFSSDAHIVAAVFASPFEDWSTVDDITRRYIIAALTRLCKKWGLNVDKAVGELNSFFEGTPQARSKRGAAPGEADGNPYARFWATQAAFLSELYKVYRRLVATSASEAACERAFSRQKQSHTDIRNRLEAESICALLRCATITVGEEQPVTDEKEEDSCRRRLTFVVPTVTLAPLRAFLITLVYCAKFAAGQELQVGSRVLLLNLMPSGALKEYTATIVSAGVARQHFFAKKLPEKIDADGAEVKPRDRFMYVDRYMMRYDGAADDHELLVSSLTEEPDEWEPLA